MVTKMNRKFIILIILFIKRKNRKLVVFVSNLFFWLSLKIRWRRKIFLTYLSTLLLALSWINFYHVIVNCPFSTRNLLESKNWSEIWSLHAKVLRSIITLNLPKARPNCTCLRILLFNLNKKKNSLKRYKFLRISICPLYSPYQKQAI